MKHPAIAPMLASLTPQQWAQTAARVDRVARYRKLAHPTAEDAKVAAGELGLQRSSFYRLVQVLEHADERAMQLRGRPRAADERVNKLIDQARSVLGPSATDRQIEAEVARLCAADAMPRPGLAMIKTKLDETPPVPDVAAKLRRRCDLVLDAAPLAFDVEDGSGKAQAAISAVVDARSGRILTHRLSAWPPGDSVATTLFDGLPPLGKRGPQLIMVATFATPKPSPDQIVDLESFGIDFDGRASRGLQTGAALRAVFGRHMGKVRILGKPLAGARDHGPPVRIALAADVIELMIHRRNESLLAVIAPFEQ